MILFTALALAASMDLDAAVARANAAGLDAQTARYAIAAAEQTLRTRKLAGGPDVRLGASVGVGVGSGWRTGSAPVGADAAVRVSASMPLYAGGALRGEQEIAAHDLALAQAEQEQTRQDLVLTLASALLDLEAARETLRTRTEALSVETALRDRINAIVAAGARTKADALQQEAAVAKARAARISATRDVAQLELMLEELLRVEDTTFLAPGAAPEGVGKERPVVLARREAAKAAAVAVAVAGASGRPALDLGMSAGTGWASGDAASGLLDRAGVDATLSLSVPLWDHEVTRAAVAQAQIDAALADLALEDAERAARTDVRQAQVDVEAAAAGEEAATARVTAATAATRVVQDRYNGGSALITELLAARAEQVDAEVAAAQARVEVIRAAYGLAWAQGGL